MQLDAHQMGHTPFAWEMGSITPILSSFASQAEPEGAEDPCPSFSFTLRALALNRRDG